MQYSRQDDPNIGTVFFSWAQGMMSGLNIGKINFGEQSVNVNSNTTEAQMAFIINYCERYPLKRYVEAVMALYKEMGGIP